MTLLRHSHADQIIHSFIHALSSVLDHLRTQLADSVDFDLPTTDASGLTAVWTRYGLIEDVLNALGRLCGRVRMFPHPNRSILTFQPSNKTPYRPSINHCRQQL